MITVSPELREALIERHGSDKIDIADFIDAVTALVANYEHAALLTREPIFLYPSEWDYFEKRGVDMRPYRKLTKVGGEPL